MIIIALLLLSLICFVIVGAIICLKLIGINLVDMVAGLTPPSNLQSDLLRLPISTRRRVLSRVKPIFEENAFLATQLERGGNPISLLKRLIANCRKLEAIAELYLSASVLADWRNARKLFEQMLQEPKKELKTQTAPATDETFLSLLEQPLTNGVLSERAR